MSKLELPNGVKLNGKLYNLVELDEIRGKHQNMLVNPKVKTPVDYIEPILMDLLVDLRDKESNSILDTEDKKNLILNLLPIQDIQFILVKIREISYSDRFIMNRLECTHCSAINNAQLSLSDLEVFPRKDKIEEKDQVLPKEKVKYTYGYMTLGKLMKLAIEDGTDELTDSLMTSITSFMVDSLGDKTEVKPSDLDDLRGSDLDYIKDNAPELAEIDLKITHTCTKCGEDFDSELPVLVADFLLHTRT